jgi:hypothetical protein
MSCGSHVLCPWDERFPGGHLVSDRELTPEEIGVLNAREGDCVSAFVPAGNRPEFGRLHLAVPPFMRCLG